MTEAMSLQMTATMTWAEPVVWMMPVEAVQGMERVIRVKMLLLAMQVVKMLVLVAIVMMKCAAVAYQCVQHE
jgi:hypothetical protein